MCGFVECIAGTGRVSFTHSVLSSLFGPSIPLFRRHAAAWQVRCKRLQLSLYRFDYAIHGSLTQAEGTFIIPKWQMFE